MSVTDAELYDRMSEFISDNKRELFDRLAPLRTRHITAVLEDIYQPHNASAVVRTCDLLGIQDIHIIENRNKFTVNPDVTLGSSKWTTMHRHRGAGDNTLECVRTLKTAGYRIVVTSPRGEECTPATIDLQQPLAFCFGTELTGASDALMEHADVRLRIPMYGFTESYNISVSAAITLYTVMERLRSSNIEWLLDEASMNAMKLDWARKVLQSADHIEQRIRDEASKR